MSGIGGWPDGASAVCEECGKPFGDGVTLWGWVDISISQLAEMNETIEVCSSICFCAAMERYIASVRASVAGKQPMLDADGSAVWVGDKYEPPGNA